METADLATLTLSMMEIAVNVLQDTMAMVSLAIDAITAAQDVKDLPAINAHYVPTLLTFSKMAHVLPPDKTSAQLEHS